MLDAHVGMKPVNSESYTDTLQMLRYLYNGARFWYRTIASARIPSSRMPVDHT